MNFENSIDPELLDYLKDAPVLYEEKTGLEKTLTRWWDKGAERPESNPLVIKDDVTIPNLAGEKILSLRIYQPVDRDSSRKLPVLLWIHGGAFIFGDNSSDEDPFCEPIVLECHCIVVSVNYRLAPQHPFPAGFDDCYAALLWFESNEAAAFSIEPEKIAIGGTSAGGCLAAGIAQRARDESGPELIYQLLLIPAIDDRHETPSSYSVTDPRVWCREFSKEVWSIYVNRIDDEFPAYAAPGRTADLSGLPPAFISVEEQDLLRDEGIDYAQRLMQSGVNTELHVYPGAFHGSFAVVPEANVSRRHTRDFLQALKKALGNDGLLIEME